MAKRLDKNTRYTLAEHLEHLLDDFYAMHDIGDECAATTAERVGNAWDFELMAGYRQNPRTILHTCFASESEQMVVLRNIEFQSTCSHHLMPFIGVAHIAYLPAGKLVGLSKLARLLECFSRRLQTQERITDQVVDALMDNLHAVGAACMIEASHTCMTARGVTKSQATMVTSAYRGAMLDDDSRRFEFLKLVC